MKKRLVALILSLCILTSFAFPAFAAETEISEADIKAVYDTYTALDTALDTNSIDKISAPLADFTEVLDIVNEMSEEDFAKLGEMMGCGSDEVFSSLLTVNINANVLTELDNRCKAFADKSNAATALSLVQYYDSIFNDPDYIDEELRALVRSFFTDIDTVCAEAKRALPAKDILGVYDAYNTLFAALESCTIEEVESALDEFSKHIDTINEMDEAEFAQLGELMHCGIEEVFSKLLTININSNVLVELNNRCKAFADEIDSATALSVVEYYDSIFNDPDYVDEELRALVRSFFTDIDEIYAEAKNALPAEELLDIYYAYVNLAAALETSMLEELETAMKAFEEQIDAINVMNDKEYEQLCKLMDCSADEVSSRLSQIYNHSSIVTIANTAYNTFCDNPNVVNAKSLIKIYDEIYNTPSTADENLQALVSSFVFGIEDAYASALEVAPAVAYTRLHGTGREETAIAISAAGFTSAENVVIASGDDFADALAGVPLAYALDAPILLVRNHKLSAENLAELKRLGAENIYILGGEFAINAQVEKTLTQKGYNVTRLSGDDRFGTSLEIAKKLNAVSGKPDEIFFVYSHNYPDALSVSSVAAIKGSPILYVGADGILKDDIAEFAKTSKAASAVIISGPAIVSDNAEGSIKKAGIDKVERIYGSNRYETCIDINKRFSNVFSGDAICVATGVNYPDALAGGVFAAINTAPMLLADGTLSAKQVEYLTGKAADDIYVFGGTGAVSNELASEIAKY